MMFLLELSFYAIIQKIAFADKVSAQEQLDLLKPKMGGEYDRLHRNESEEVTHTVKSPAGDVVVVLSKVECARLIDWTEHSRLFDPMNDDNIEYEAKRAAAIKRAERAAEGQS